MRFYEVWIASQKYHSALPLTYTSEEELLPGDIVEVPLKNTIVSAVIYREQTTKPTFDAKPIVRCIGPNIGKNLELLLWLLQYYPAPSGIITSLFVPASFPKKLDIHATRDIRYNPPSSQLTQDQARVLKSIKQRKPPTTILLHGETGTGKTRVYIELAMQAITTGKSALILTPEIGLTPQLQAMFAATFSGSIYTIHSKLTPAQRREQWLSIASSTKPVIVLGPRSALFAPIKKLGIIVLDEAHDQSYKQDQAPYYLATRVATKLALLHRSICVLGSATPLVSDYYRLSQHKMPVLRMKQKVHSTPAPQITVVDARVKKQFTKSHILSDQLLEGLQATINKKQQALVFINRRGTARFVSCEKCAWEARCPNCDVPLTYHKDDHVLRCHICNHRDSAPSVCPRCDSTNLLFKTAGSKAVIDELHRLFPEVRIERFDSDNKKGESLTQQYASLQNGDIDIMVGTQMLAKGLDIPGLIFVGIPFADSSLQLPDFTADEQTFQLITQVIGRTGRRNKQGHIVIQTYNPDNVVLKAALGKDWDSFYTQQLTERHQFNLPPFTYLLKLKCIKKKAQTAEQAAKLLAAKLSRDGSLQILGPSPAFYSKVAGAYQWQIIVKAAKRHDLLRVIDTLPTGWRYDIDPTNLM